MSLQTRLTDLVAAIGADIKSLSAQITALQSGGGGSLPTYNAVLSADQTLVALALTNIVSVSVPVGTYLVSGRAHCAYNGQGATVDGRVALGTAVGSVDGPQSDSGRTTAANLPLTLSVAGTVVTVTTAGTIVFQIYSPAAPIVKAGSNTQSYAGATGISAVKIA